MPVTSTGLPTHMAVAAHTCAGGGERCAGQHARRAAGGRIGGVREAAQGACVHAGGGEAHACMYHLCVVLGQTNTAGPHAMSYGPFPACTKLESRACGAVASARLDGRHGTAWHDVARRAGDQRSLDARTRMHVSACRRMRRCTAAWRSWPRRWAGPRPRWLRTPSRAWAQRTAR